MGAVKGTGSVEDGIEFLKGYDIIVHPRCKHVADELLHYSYKTDPLTGKVLPILADKKNHTIDALRYACEAVRRIKDKKEIKYVEYRQR
jgi:phage terminase large subunit